MKTTKNIKKIKLLGLLLIGILAFNSCSNDDEGTQNPNVDLDAVKQKLIGTWKLVGFESGGVYTSTADCPMVVVDFTALNSCSGEFYEKNSSGVCEFVQDSGTGTYSIILNELVDAPQLMVESSDGLLTSFTSNLVISHTSETELHLSGINMLDGNSYDPTYHYERE